MTQVITSKRYITHNRSLAVSNLTQALVELLTNACDAYRQTDKPVVVRTGFDPTTHQCWVTDQATGLPHDQMEHCLGSLGNKTHMEGARGIFSRGAKDVSELGDITFHSIIDDKIRTLRLCEDLTYQIDPIRMVTLRDRFLTKIKENGFYACISVIPIYWPSNLVQTIEDFNQNDSMALLFADHANTFTWEISGVSHQTGCWRYTFPPGETNTFQWETSLGKVTMTVTIVPDKLASTQMGFLIVGQDGVYGRECFTPEIRASPYTRYIHGVVECHYIRQLMEDLEDNKRTQENPFPIITPSRKGLALDHPYTKELYGKIEIYMKKIINDIRKRKPESSSTSAKLNDVISRLYVAGHEIFDLDMDEDDDDDAQQVFDLIADTFVQQDHHLFPVPEEEEQEQQKQQQKKPRGMTVHVDFTDDESDTPVSYLYEQNTVTITIHTHHALVEGILILNPDGVVDGHDTSEGKMLLSTLIARGITCMLIDRIMLQDPHISGANLVHILSDIQGKKTDVFARKLYDNLK